MIGVAPEIVHVQHYAEPKPVRLRDKGTQGRGCSVIGIIAVIAILPPTGQVKERLRRGAMRRQVFEQRLIEVHGDHEPDAARPRRALFFERQQLKARLGPLPVDGGAGLPIARISPDAPAAGNDLRLILKGRKVPALKLKPEGALGVIENQALEAVRMVLGPDDHTAARPLDQHEGGFPHHRIVKRPPLGWRVRAKPLAAAARH